MTSQLSDDERQALRGRYRAERDKRLRVDGNNQYLEATGRYANLLDDPYTPVVSRAPLRTDVQVLVIGAGFGGLVIGARLKQAGISDVRLIDKAGDVGGVWYWNRYPGAMCDTAAMVYLPLLEETGTVPSAKYVAAPEIQAHAQRIADTFDLRRDALLSTGVESIVWDESLSRYIVHTDRGDVLRAKYVCTSTGPLHLPKLPGISGIHSFVGHAFHTSRWDYAYTGGDAKGAPMTGLANKRVGIIGTGATAVQCIPHLSYSAGELFVFQRTPSSIDVRNNHEIDPQWFAELEPGWQRKWMTNFTVLQTLGFAEEDLVKDGWTDISIRIRDRMVELVKAGRSLGPETLLQAYEESDDEKMNEVRARVDAIVGDERTADALKPWYRQLCKRPCFHDEYLQSFNNPNTHLIDTDGKGVERIDEHGAWVQGVHYPLDCLIIASGFEVGTSYSRRSGFDIAGRNGIALSEYWGNGMRSMHGIHVREFPNLFVIGFTQGANQIANVPQNYVENGLAIADIIAHAEANDMRQVEPTQTAQDDWLTFITSNTRGLRGNPDCTPGYYNNEGKPMSQSDTFNGSGHPGGPVAFFEFLDAWRQTGKFAGLTFTK
ncbi:MAG: NAD(P)/FAD-dependent oxidoreductase [Actinobacteria bacterium]|nr:NAD(P)/FAD-dependent oxidoreductase [Actinomycetota bacterium]